MTFQLTDMEKEKEIKFHRLVAFLMDIPPDVIRKYILRKILLNGETFQEYLEKNKHTLYHLYESIICCMCRTNVQIKFSKVFSKEQFRILFKHHHEKINNSHTKRKGKRLVQNCICTLVPIDGIDVSVLDITLAKAILTNCEQTLHTGVSNWLEQIVKARNEIFHLTDLHPIDDNRYNYYWGMISSSVDGLSKLVGQEYNTFVKDKVEKLKLKFKISGIESAEERLCRDYWRDKCVKFENNHRKELGKYEELLESITEETQKYECFQTCTDMMKKIDGLCSVVDDIIINVCGNTTVRNIVESRHLRDTNEYKTIPVFMQIQVPQMWDTAKLVSSIENICEKYTSDMPMKITSFSTEDVEILAEIWKFVLTKANKLQEEIGRFIHELVTLSGIRAQDEQVDISIIIDEEEVKKGKEELDVLHQMETRNISSSYKCKKVSDLKLKVISADFSANTCSIESDSSLPDPSIQDHSNDPPASPCNTLISSNPTTNEDKEVPGMSVIRKEQDVDEDVRLMWAIFPDFLKCSQNLPTEVNKQTAQPDPERKNKYPDETLLYDRTFQENSSIPLNHEDLENDWKTRETEGVDNTISLKVKEFLALETIDDKKDEKDKPCKEISENQEKVSPVSGGFSTDSKTEKPLENKQTTKIVDTLSKSTTNITKEQECTDLENRSQKCTDLENRSQRLLPSVDPVGRQIFHINRQIKLSTAECYIESAISKGVFMNGVNILLLDSSNKKIYKYHILLQTVKEEIELQSEPYDLAVMNESIIAITMPDTTKIELHNVEDRVNNDVKYISTDRWCYAISVTTSDYVVVCMNSTNKGLKFINKSNTNAKETMTMKVHKKDGLYFSGPYLYYTNYTNKYIACYSDDRQLHFTFEDKPFPFPPIGMAMIDKDTLYIVCETADCIWHVDISIKRHKPVESGFESVVKPCVILCSDFTRELFILDYINNLFVYEKSQSDM
ncbi:unnamed protein product [Mytilus coruscus]|uniref:DZIP3-like HEPN domain-containing protein n=1 Tax=Mytilus coruscus TaxID=42192 RepID=A0A6J8C3Q3_MYTCO|nr:unnamed protein product [Mytilus coruscus]